MRDDERDQHSKKAALPADQVLRGEGSEECWSLKIEVGAEHAAWLVARLGELGFSAFEERTLPRRKQLLVYADSEERLREVEGALWLRARAEPKVPDLACQISRVGTEWRLEWTRHLEPVQLTPTLRAVPHRPEGEPQPSDLYLEPALAFGFGEHPTTGLIATWLESSCRSRPLASVLDAGTGTGVLALVASRNGARRVVGVDTSADAIRAARANVESNRAHVELVHGSLFDVDGSFDIVVANIEANVLMDLAVPLRARVGPDGCLALAGLIDEQVEEVTRRYREVGLLLGVVARAGDWCLLASA